jgi:hypothetical protein
MGSAVQKVYKTTNSADIEELKQASEINSLLPPSKVLFPMTI